MSVTPPTKTDLRWQSAAEELAPHKSLTRLAANARSVITTIAVVATLLAGLGAFAAAQLTDHPLLMTFAAISVAAAAAAVILSLIALVNRENPLAVGDLEQVKEWYKNRLAKGQAAAWGGVMLIIAVGVAAITSVGGLVWGAWDRDPAVQMSLAVARKGDASTVHLSADAKKVPSGATVRVQLKDNNKVEWFNGAVSPGGSGAATLTQDVEVSSSAMPLHLDVRVMDGKKTLKTFSLSNSEG
ncbi:hypothetical protein ACF09H_08715 [Streptomyces sp. NPDC014983]|uniref:hypothetical protein n=1 Tax=Streptomyces sp. NPDC014983 TaxID=3364933 RepID=UPI0036FEC7A4